MTEVSEWISANIDSLLEEDLIDIVAALCGLEYSSPQIVQAFEKYVKVHDKVSITFISV